MFLLLTLEEEEDYLDLFPLLTPDKAEDLTPATPESDEIVWK